MLLLLTTQFDAASISGLSLGPTKEYDFRGGLEKMFETAREVVKKCRLHRGPATVADCESAKPANDGKIEFGSPTYFLYCAMGGALSCGSTHTLIVPLDLVKCRLQVNPKKYKNIPNGFKVTLAEDGKIGMLRGWAPTLIGYSLQGTCKFGFYEYFKIKYADLIGPEAASKNQGLVWACASASAELIADVFLVPFESMKVKIQTMEGYAKNMREVVPKMVAEEGMNAFFKSLVPLWCRQVPYTVMKFVSFEATRDALYKYVVGKPRESTSKGENLFWTFVAGYIAGVLCAVVSHPADTLVSKMNQFKGKPISEVIKETGWAGLWKGLTPRIIMIGTLTALQWFIYDSFKTINSLPAPPKKK